MARSFFERGRVQGYVPSTYLRITGTPEEVQLVAEGRDDYDDDFDPEE